MQNPVEDPEIRKRIQRIFGPSSIHEEVFDGLPLLLEAGSRVDYGRLLDRCRSEQERRDMWDAFLWLASPAGRCLDLGFEYQDDEGNLHDLPPASFAHAFRNPIGDGDHEVVVDGRAVSLSDVYLYFRLNLEGS